MPKAKLTDLANPVRYYKTKHGDQIPYKPLTLRNLAEIEVQHGDINSFLARVAQGEITPALVLLETAAKNADPNINIGDLFVVGDMREGADAYNLLMQILADSGFEVQQGNPNDAQPNPTGRPSTP